MYRNALNEVGKILNDTKGIKRVYIQQRDFRDKLDVFEVLGKFINGDEVLAVVKTSGMTGMSSEYGLKSFEMGLTIELFCPIDNISDYNKSSEAQFDLACLTVLKKFSSQYGIQVVQLDGQPVALFINAIESASEKRMVVLEEAEKSAHSVVFNLSARESLI